jgi:hypothetical protein
LVGEVGHCPHRTCCHRLSHRVADFGTSSRRRSPAAAKSQLNEDFRRASIRRHEVRLRIADELREGDQHDEFVEPPASGGDGGYCRSVSPQVSVYRIRKWFVNLDEG